MNSSIDSDNNVNILSSFKNNLNHDLFSALVVALMTVPMSLGVAVASGFPPAAGLISSIVGGLLITFWSGTNLAIKGPAGGLSAIMLGAVFTLGNGNTSLGVSYALVVVVLAGFIQMLFGLIRLGSLADFFPSSTIHGMLAALGIMMAAKQVYLMLGIQPETQNTFQLLVQLPSLLTNSNPKVAVIGILSLVVLIGTSYLPNKIFRYVPSPLIIVLISIPLAHFLGIREFHQYQFGSKNFTIDPNQLLISIPSDFSKIITLPNIEKIFTLQTWEYVAMLAFASTIESLLSNKAIDRLDPQKRTSNQNRDLFAIGLGSVFSGLLGGLPMISETKRSVININNGGLTKWTNFFHGVYLLIIVLVGIKFMNLIPYAALAAMLVHTGARMATPTELSKSYKVGLEQFIVFSLTLLITLVSNFMWGIAAGILTELIIHMRFGVTFYALFNAKIKLLKDKDNNYELVFDGPAIFSNYLDIKKILDRLPDMGNISFDFAKATVVDHTFMDHLNSFEVRRRNKGGQIAIAGLEYHKHLSEHPLASKRIIKLADLTVRQKTMQFFADKNGILYEPRMMLNTKKFSSYSSAKGNVIKLEENILKYVFKSYQIEFSDVLIERGGQTVAKQDYKMTMAVVSNFPNIMPEFTLQKEGFIENLFALAGFNDIDFEEYPNFSYYYLLKGADELHIRNFFNSNVIEFFEQNKGYNLESKNGTLLIYKKLSILSVEEIELFTQFLQKLLKVMYHEFEDE
jgi:MFS superfamily sulfate permease-like transporter